MGKEERGSLRMTATRSQRGENRQVSNKTEVEWKMGRTNLMAEVGRHAEKRGNMKMPSYTKTTAITGCTAEHTVMMHGLRGSKWF